MCRGDDAAAARRPHCSAACACTSAEVGAEGWRLPIDEVREAASTCREERCSRTTGAPRNVGSDRAAAVADTAGMGGGSPGSTPSVVAAPPPRRTLDAIAACCDNAAPAAAAASAGLQRLLLLQLLGAASAATTAAPEPPSAAEWRPAAQSCCCTLLLLLLPLLLLQRSVGLRPDDAQLDHCPALRPAAASAMGGDATPAALDPAAPAPSRGWPASGSPCLACCGPPCGAVLLCCCAVLHDRCRPSGGPAAELPYEAERLLALSAV